MGKARGLRKTPRVVGEGARWMVSKPRPVTKTKRTLHKEALKLKRGRGTGTEFPVWLSQVEEEQLIQPKTKLGLASLADSLGSLKQTKWTKDSTPTSTVVPSKRKSMAAEALQLAAIVQDDRFQSHPFEALQKHLKVTVAGCSSSLKQEEASHSLSAAPHSGHCHRKTRKKHHGKIGKLRKPPKNT